nr:hypothetical protein [Allomuricauda sp.]
MEDSYTFIYALGSILGTLAQLVVIVGCIVLVSKKKNPATIIMLVGSILSLLVSILNFSGTFIAAQYSTDSILTWTKFFAILWPLPYILFAIGLLWYAVNYVKK